MNDDNNDLRASIAAIRRGDKEQARAALTHLLKRDPRNELAWLCLSVVMPTREAAGQCIEQSLAFSSADRPRIGEWLIRQGLITPDELQHALTQQVLLRRQGHAVHVGTLLVRAGFLQRDALERALLTLEYHDTPAAA